MSKRRRNTNIRVPAKKRKQEARAKHWFLTNNNLTFTNEDYNGLIKDGKLAPDLTWCMLGMHIGEKSGRIHMHAVIALRYKERKTALIKRYSAWAIVPRRGTIPECKVYLSKNDEYCDMGVPPKPSIADIWENTIKCCAEHRIYDAEPMHVVRYIGNLKRIQADHPQKLASLPVKKCHYWIYNPISDAGKTWYAEHRWPDNYAKGPGNKWWGGYKGQETVIINNVSPVHMHPQSALRKNLISPWADTPAFNMEMKGEEILIRPKRIIVTSQYPIEKIFDYSTTEMGAALTRFILLDLEHVDMRRIKAMLIMRSIARWCHKWFYYFVMPYMVQTNFK